MILKAPINPIVTYKHFYGWVAVVGWQRSGGRREGGVGEGFGKREGLGYTGTMVVFD